MNWRIWLAVKLERDITMNGMIVMRRAATKIAMAMETAHMIAISGDHIQKVGCTRVQEAQNPPQLVSLGALYRPSSFVAPQQETYDSYW